MHILLEWLILSVAVWVAAAVTPGVKLKGALSAVLVAGIFGVLNFLVGWLIFGVIGIVTLGVGFLLAFVTRWVVNALLLKVTDLFTDRLTIDGLGTAGEWLVRLAT